MVNCTVSTYTDETRFLGENLLLHLLPPLSLVDLVLFLVSSSDMKRIVSPSSADFECFPLPYLLSDILLPPPWTAADILLHLHSLTLQAEMKFKIRDEKISLSTMFTHTYTK